MNRTQVPRRDEDGVAVVMALGLVAVLLLVAVLAAGSVALVATHRQAQAAADLAALAGAQAARSASAPCAVAATVATANGAELRECTVEASTVTVSVAATFSLGAFSRDLVGRARAGPS